MSTSLRGRSESYGSFRESSAPLVSNANPNAFAVSHRAVQLYDDQRCESEQVSISTYATNSSADYNKRRGQTLNVSLACSNKHENENFAHRVLLTITIVISLLIVCSTILFRGFGIGRIELASSPLAMSVFLDDESTTRFEVADGTYDYIGGHKIKRILASGTYIKDANHNGWHHLTIRAGEGFSSSPSAGSKDIDTSLNYIRSMQAAGYVEGYATCAEIGQYYANFYLGLFDGGDPTRDSLEFLEENFRWMKTQSERQWQTSDYWLAVKGLISQLEGLLEGIKKGCPGFQDPREGPDDPSHYKGVYLPGITRNPSLIHLLLVNADGDLFQIAAKFDQINAPPTEDNDDDDSRRLLGDVSVASASASARAGSIRGINNSSGMTRDELRQVRRKKVPFIRTEKASALGLDRDKDKDTDLGAGIRETQSTSTPHAEEEVQEEEDLVYIKKWLPEHCSAIVKLLPDKSDVLIAHNTWDDFQGIGPRIFKHYSLPLVQSFPHKEKYSEDNNGDKTWKIVNEIEVAAGLGLGLRSGLRSGLDGSNTANGQSASSTSRRSNGLLRKKGGGDRERSRRGRGRGEESSNSVSTETDDAALSEDDYVYDDVGSEDSSSGNSGNSGGDSNNDSGNASSKKYGPPSGRFELRFSSYPGIVTSMDDFFTVIGRGHLVVMETTIDVYNETLLAVIKPDSMLSWARARLSNLFAADGAEWASVFSMHKSGTYANQWMVVDLSKFETGLGPSGGFLTVLEEIPGFMHIADLTAQLESTGYWASYNNPYFDDIADFSGNKALCEEDPNTCYYNDPRANIFRRRQGEVKDLHDLQKLISFNNWREDPLSVNDSCYAIACRLDQEPVPSHRYPFGSIDGKVTSRSMIQDALRAEFGGTLHKTAVTVMESSSPIVAAAAAEEMSLISSSPSSSSSPVDSSARKMPNDNNNNYNSNDNTDTDTNTNPNNNNNKGGDVAAATRKAHSPYVLARLGPTTDHQPEFCWHQVRNRRDRRGKLFEHAGQPDCFNFQWQPMPPMP